MGVRAATQPGFGMEVGPRPGRTTAHARFVVWVALLVAAISIMGSALAGPLTERGSHPAGAHHHGHTGIHQDLSGRK